MREMLEPNIGIELALPPDEKLKADLAAPSYKLIARGLQVEGKDELRKRLKHLPDRGDAVVYCAMASAPYYR